MLKRLKKNKILFSIIVITIFAIIIGFILAATLNNETKITISTNANNIIKNITKEKIIISELFNKILLSNNILILIIWLLGISIIGLPINIIIYILKVISTTIEIIFLIKIINLSNILIILLYLISKIINILIIFLLLYYSSNYSLIIFNIIFRNKNYEITKITKKYLKILLIIIIINIINSFLEYYIIPQIFTKLI